MSILIFLYYITIVILTTHETLRKKNTFLPYKNSLKYYKSLSVIIFIMSLSIESIFTSTIYQFTNNSLYIIICDMLLKNLLIYKKNIKYKIYIEYMLVMIIHRLLVIYVLKNYFILAFIFSIITITLALTTHIYVYNQYIKTKRRNRNRNFRSISVRNRSRSFSGHKKSKLRKLYNFMKNIDIIRRRRIHIYRRQIPNDIKILLDKYYAN